MSNQYFYLMKGEPYAYGPTAPYRTERQVRAAIREAWGLKTLHGVQIWKA